MRRDRIEVKASQYEDGSNWQENLAGGTYSKLGADPDTLDVDLHKLVERVDGFVLDATAVRVAKYEASALPSVASPRTDTGRS